MQYYFLNNQKLKIGDVVYPGTWGSAVMGTPGHRYSKMEAQFEQVRLSVDPNLPSRLQSIFLFDNYGMAKRFQELQRQTDSFYEVRILNGFAPRHTADMMLIHPELELWDAQWGNPKLYWKSANIETTVFREVLVVSPVEVVRVVNSGLGS